METARRMSGIKPSATLAMNAKTLELRARGVAVTSLAVGEPDFPTPAHIREAACAAIAEGFTRYTAVAGIPELREAVAGYYRRCYGVTADPACVIIENGGKQALYNLFLALLNPGDEVLVPSPYWVSYPDMVRLAEGVPVPVAAPASRGFKVSPADLEAARTSKTRVLVFNSPSNPTGACYSRPESDAIMQWALDHGIFVIADEIYDQLVYPPAQPASVSIWWEKYPERFAIANGLSKSFAMTGWRVAYPGAPRSDQGDFAGTGANHRQCLFHSPKGGGRRSGRLVRLRGRNARRVSAPSRHGPCGNRLLAGRRLPQTGWGLLSLCRHFRAAHARSSGCGSALRLPAGKGPCGDHAWRRLWRAGVRAAFLCRVG